MPAQRKVAVVVDSRHSPRNVLPRGNIAASNVSLGAITCGYPIDRHDCRLHGIVPGIAECRKYRPIEMTGKKGKNVERHFTSGHAGRRW